MAPGILSIFYLAFGLSSGVIVNYVLSRLDYEPSFTLVMFLIGVVTAIIAGMLTGTQSHETLYEAVGQWVHLDPEVILYALLPILLFGEAQTLSLHHVKKVFYSAALLAIPGAAFTAYMLALLMKFALGLTWEWNLCWLFGCVLCATDPVSVVAMLKTVASPTTVQYLVILEALINDGIALVLFEIVGSRKANELGGDQITAHFSLYFVKVLLTSPLLGLAVGLAATTCMTYLDRRLLSRDDLMQVAVTVCAAYLSFFLAQYWGLSGVLSCCAAGLVVSYMGRPLVLNPGGLTLVWGCLEWSANTLIFLVSGLIVGSRSVYLFDAQSLLAIFVVYLALFAIRGVMLVVCHLPLRWHMPDYTAKAGCFVTFSGLRGAISLTLAVLLARHARRPGPGDDETSDLILFELDHVERAVFIIAWVVALTILINGSLASLVLRRLGIASAVGGDSVMLSYVSLRLRTSASKEYQQLRREFPEHSVEYLTRCGDVLRGAVEGPRAWSAELERLAEPGPGSLNGACYAFEPCGQAERGLELGYQRPLPLASAHNHEGDGERVGDDDGDGDGDQGEDVALSGRRDQGSARPASPATPSSPSSSSDPVTPAVIDAVLLEQFRGVFLKVVHLSYLQQISDGKLPRGSQAALVLLDSVEHGLDTVHTLGLQDFEDLRSELGEWLSERALNLVLRCCCCSCPWAEALRGRLRRARHADQVHALLAFVEAHNYAQAKVPYYLGPTTLVNSPEEELLVRESQDNVAAALRVLHEGYSPVALKEILSRKVASIILHSQEELILHFHDEGILGSLEAAFLHGALQDDIQTLRRVSDS